MQLVLAIMVLSFYTASSQVFVDGQDINQIEGLNLIEVVGKGKLFSSDVKIAIDYGQDRSFLKKAKDSVKDKEGKTMKFSGMMDALNFLEANGWEYLDAYVLTSENISGKQNVYHYIMRRKLD